MSHRIHFLIFTGLLLIFCSYRKENWFEWQMNQRHMEVPLSRKSNSLYIIHLNTNQLSHSIWELPYPAYRFDYGDVTGDGMPEIIVGVVKSTRFDPKPDKRLFIYRIADETHIRPLWPGSRVTQPLEDFRVIHEHTPVLMRTMEQERSGKHLIAEYAWRGFGLNFKGYLKRETEEKETRYIPER